MAKFRDLNDAVEYARVGMMNLPNFPMWAIVEEGKFEMHFQNEAVEQIVLLDNESRQVAWSEPSPEY